VLGFEVMSGKDNTRIDRGSGNVFADLDRPEAEPHILKAEIVARIDQIIRERRLTQARVAELFGISKPDVSCLQRGSFRDYSVERLRNFLTVIERDTGVVGSEPRALHHGNQARSIKPRQGWTEAFAREGPSYDCQDLIACSNRFDDEEWQ